MHKRGLYMPSVCPSVRPSVTFTYSVETCKHNFNFFSPSGSYDHSSFSTPKRRQYSDGNPPPLRMHVGWVKIEIFDQCMASRAVNCQTAKRNINSCAGPWQDGDTHRRFCFITLMLQFSMLPLLFFLCWFRPTWTVFQCLYIL